MNESAEGRNVFDSDLEAAAAAVGGGQRSKRPPRTAEVASEEEEESDFFNEDFDIESGDLMERMRKTR